MFIIFKIDLRFDIKGFYLTSKNEKIQFSQPIFFNSCICLQNVQKSSILTMGDSKSQKKKIVPGCSYNYAMRNLNFFTNFNQVAKTHQNFGQSHNQEDCHPKTAQIP